MSPASRRHAGAWGREDAAWRDPVEVIGSWGGFRDVEPRLLAARTSGAFWDVLAQTGKVLLVTREYEHLVLALRASGNVRETSYLRLPHPSGIAVDPSGKALHVALTRNPNQVAELRPVTALLERTDAAMGPLRGRPLVPVRTRFLPGSLYLHELSFLGGVLHANAVGQNAVVRIVDGGFERVWWPRCIEGARGPVFERNQIQLNSIAAGKDLSTSFFSASTDEPGSRRPGHRNFAVDRRGVLFSGATREPVARGLTRPHSARLHRGRLWVDDSGYGELAVVEDGSARTVARLPGWTRGLCFAKGVAFVGTSRVIPRFRSYAPGLDARRSVCGVHAVDTATGARLGSLVWPHGYQVFSVELMPASLATGFPFVSGDRGSAKRARHLFYSFRTGRA